VRNAIERKNLDTIREAEAKKHEHIEPGDLRFFSDRAKEFFDELFRDVEGLSSFSEEDEARARGAAP